MRVFTDKEHKTLIVLVDPGDEGAWGYEFETGQINRIVQVEDVEIPGKEPENN